jgi:hypothetical protein
MCVCVCVCVYVRVRELLGRQRDIHYVAVEPIGKTEKITKKICRYVSLGILTSCSLACVFLVPLSSEQNALARSDRV